MVRYLEYWRVNLNILFFFHCFFSFWYQSCRKNRYVQYKLHEMFVSGKVDGNVRWFYQIREDLFRVPLKLLKLDIR